MVLKGISPFPTVEKISFFVPFTNRKGVRIQVPPKSARGGWGRRSEQVHILGGSNPRPVLTKGSVSNSPTRRDRDALGPPPSRAHEAKFAAPADELEPLVHFARIKPLKLLNF